MKYLGFIFMFIFIAGCSKEVQTNKHLNGTWKPIYFSVYDYNGLKNDTKGEGFLKFAKDGKKSVSGTYEVKLKFQFQGNPAFYEDHGTYVIENGNVAMLKSEVDGSVTMSTIVYLTDDDLKIEIPNKDYLGYNFIMKKEK